MMKKHIQITHEYSLIEDIFQAYYDARKNKRNSESALEFELEYEKNLVQLFWDIPNGVGTDFAIITYASQLCQSSTSQIRCWDNTNNESFTYSRVASGSWEHVVVVISFSTNQMKFYLNGQLQQTSTITVTKDASTWNDMYIGQYRGNSRRFSGKIDDLRVYSRILSDAEVLALYNS